MPEEAKTTETFNIPSPANEKKSPAILVLLEIAFLKEWLMLADVETGEIQYNSRASFDMILKSYLSPVWRPPKPRRTRSRAPIREPVRPNLLKC